MPGGSISQLVGTDGTFTLPYLNVADESQVVGRIKLKNSIDGAKYLAAKKGHLNHGSHLYIIDSELKKLSSGKWPLIIVEGEKKTLAVIAFLRQIDKAEKYCVIGVAGVTQWQHCPEWIAFKVKLSGRDIYIVFDADGASNPDVRREEWKISAWLQCQKANPMSILWPVERGKGIDDYIVAGGNLLKILNEAKPTIEVYNKRPLSEVLGAISKLIIDPIQAEILSGEIRKYYKELSAKKIADQLMINYKTAKREAAIKKAKKANKPTLIISGGDLTINDMSATLGSALAIKGNIYNRDNDLVRISGNPAGDHILKYPPLAYWPSEFETVVEFKKKSLKNDLVRAICPKTTAELIRYSDQFINSFPILKILSPSPVLVERPNGNLEIITGYDPDSGILAAGDQPEIMDLQSAINIIESLLRDFRYTTKADKSRAVAALISPALIFGALIKGRSPLLIAEADQSQAGKGFFLKVIAACHGISAVIITQRKSGLGGLEEAFDAALIQAALMIFLDNIRQRLDSPQLESFQTEPYYSARIPYRQHVQIETSKIILMMTSNQTELTKDLVNRSIAIRLLKQPQDYQFIEYSEGNLIEHIKAHQPRYQGAIFRIVQEWHQRGKPKTNETGHSFRPWVQVMDWIVQNIFELPPLLMGHTTAQQRMVNPTLTWIRDIALSLLQHGQDGRWLRINEIVDLIIDEDILLPGLQRGGILTEDNRRAVLQACGRKVSRCFRLAESDQITVDGIDITRREDISSLDRHKVRVYRFIRSDRESNNISSLPEATSYSIDQPEIPF